MSLARNQETIRPMFGCQACHNIESVVVFGVLNVSLRAESNSYSSEENFSKTTRFEAS